MSAHAVDTTVTTAETDISAFARAVALKRATVTAVVGTALSVASSFGWITPDLSDHLDKGIAGAFAFLAVLGAGAWIHTGTTPANLALNPKSSTGEDLVSADVAAKAVVAATAAQAVDVTPDGLIPETGESALVLPDPAPAPTAAPAAAPVAS